MPNTDIIIRKIHPKSFEKSLIFILKTDDLEILYQFTQFHGLFLRYLCFVQYYDLGIIQFHGSYILDG